MRADVREIFRDLVCVVDEGYAVVDRSDADAVHTLRKRAKRVRYVSESFAGLLSEGAAAEGRRMKGVQDLLGDICDARVNVAMAGEFPAEGLSDEARRALETLIARNQALLDEFLAG